MPERSSSLRVLIAGGGTGGHVIPALAIGRELRDRHGAEVRMLGTARGLEVGLAPEAGFPLELIQVGQLNQVSLRIRLRTVGNLPLGVARCLALIRRFRPSLVVGVGGYASGPAMMAAQFLRVPTLAYEPNAVPGLANRLIGRRVDAAAVNFAETAAFFRNAVVTGVPVRREIFDIEAKAPGSAPRLLITAGSQGARVFNETMPLIVCSLLAAVPGLTILHQSGTRAFEQTTQAYATSGADPTAWEVRAFIDDMAEQYAACDLVLARAGSTVAELAAAGKPSLLVPFPQAADDHQRKNAEAMARAGAAEVILQGELTPEKLLARLVALFAKPEALLLMGKHARTISHPGAVEKIAELCLSIAHRR